MSKKKRAILLALQKNGPMYPNDIRRETGQWMTFVISRLSALEGEGFVERELIYHESIRMNRHRFKLTTHGRKKLIETPELGALWKPLPAL